MTLCVPKYARKLMSLTNLPAHHFTMFSALSLGGPGGGNFLPFSDIPFFDGDLVFLNGDLDLSFLSCYSYTS